MVFQLGKHFFRIKIKYKNHLIFIVIFKFIVKNQIRFILNTGLKQNFNLYFNLNTKQGLN